jgi:hypothetical protein
MSIGKPLILDTKGNVLVGFKPVQWESDKDDKRKAADSLRSFL